MVIIFSYNRREMLAETIKPLKREKHIIIDDGSDYKDLLPNTIRIEHQGREGFVNIFNFAFELCEETDDDFFMFMGDDFQNIDIETIKKRFEQFKEKPFIYNIIKDNRENCFMVNDNYSVDEFTEYCGFNDAGFFCNRKALELLNFRLNPVNQNRFKNPARSTGVGEQLTQRLFQLDVPMYRPKKSLAYHGDHDSVMHYEERKKNKLISL